MKRILIALLLLISMAASGWLLYQNGFTFPNRLGNQDGHIPPVAIADTATAYTLAQRENLEKSRPHGLDPVWIDHFEDRSFVPPPINYVRLEYYPRSQEKMLSKIFLADSSFPINLWDEEYVAIVKTHTIRSVLTGMENLNCESNSNDLNAHVERLEILLRSSESQLKRCLLRHGAACRFMRHIKWQTLSDFKTDRVSRYYLAELMHKMECYGAKSPPN